MLSCHHHMLSDYTRNRFSQALKLFPSLYKLSLNFSGYSPYKLLLWKQKIFKDGNDEENQFNWNSLEDMEKFAFTESLGM
ncbi:hypothetical protein M5689_019013 [Euphorbia peplus]|nr:hypothetical protein M5689_019013 [Euphorbia peplus]